MNRKMLLLLAASALTVTLNSCQGGGGSEKPQVPEPFIQSISTDYDGNKAVAGEPVTLYGLNFSPVASENKVLYGVGLDAVALRVNESSEEHVVFTAPDLGRTELKIRVSTNGAESNQVVLQYTTKPEPEEEEEWDPTPTIDFAKMGGTTITIRPGIEWTYFHGTWKGQTRNINIVRTTLNEHNKLGMYFNYGTTYPDGYDPQCKDGEDPRDLDKKCIYLDAIVGTNGPMACCQFARVNGEIKHGASTDHNPWIANCAMTIDGDVVDIVKVASDVAAAKLTNDPDGNRNPPYNTLTVGCAGPLLVWNGKVQPYEDGWKEKDTDKWLTTTHPRTAFGLSKDGKTVVQVAVDGRWTSDKAKKAIGMATETLGELMRGLGCYKAMNFDGGGGTAMWVYGQGNARNIVNSVSENRTDNDGKYIWDWNGTKLRPTGNAVYIKSDLK